MSKANVRMSTRAICEAAIFIALALALSPLEIKLWAQGGSVEFVMIPLFIFALRWGVGWGIGASVVYGILNCIIFGGIAYGWQALILDYAIAYGCCGLAGFFRGRKYGVEAGTIVGCAARFICHLISGVVIWASYMPPEFMGLSMNNVWFYSTLYNGSYMLLNTVIALIVLILLKVPLGKYLRAEDIKLS